MNRNLHGFLQLSTVLPSQSKLNSIVSPRRNEEKNSMKKCNSTVTFLVSIATVILCPPIFALAFAYNFFRGIISITFFDKCPSSILNVHVRNKSSLPQIVHHVTDSSHYPLPKILSYHTPTYLSNAASPKKFSSL